MLRVDIGNTITTNYEVADANGALWYTTDLEGWDSPTMRQSIANPTNRHGGIISESLFGVRSLVVKGICKAPSEAAFWISYNRLLSVLANVNVDISLIVYETTPKFVSVRRADNIRIRFIGVGSFEFEIPLVAVDPLKYSATLHSSAYGAVTNAGVFNSPHVVITTTSTGTPSFSNSSYGVSASLDFVSSIPSGTVIDMKNRTVQNGVTDHYGATATTSTWWHLVPGANSLGISGVSATIAYRDAWI